MNQKATAGFAPSPPSVCSVHVRSHTKSLPLLWGVPAFAMQCACPCSAPTQVGEQLDQCPDPPSVLSTHVCSRAVGPPLLCMHAGQVGEQREQCHG